MNTGVWLQDLHVGFMGWEREAKHSLGLSIAVPLPGQASCAAMAKINLTPTKFEEAYSSTNV